MDIVVYRMIGVECHPNVFGVESDRILEMTGMFGSYTHKIVSGCGIHNVASSSIIYEHRI